MNLYALRKNLPTLWVFGLLGLLALTFLSQMFFHSREKLTSKEQYAVRTCMMSTSSSTLSDMITCLQKQQSMMASTSTPGTPGTPGTTTTTTRPPVSAAPPPPAAAPGAPSADGAQCTYALMNYGFIPKVTWGNTPANQRDATCDDKLCPFFKDRFGTRAAVVAQYGAQINAELDYCKSKNLLPPTF